MQQPSSIPAPELVQRTLSNSFIRFAGEPEEPWFFLSEPRLTVPDARLRRLARQVHDLGERPLYELFRELIAGHDPLARIERYAALDAGVVAALGGDRLPDHVRVVP